MKVAVVGRGLMGAAAGRHLAKAGIDVTMIGPDEPADKAAHRGVFGSHYDEGRITRKCARDPFWVHASQASIARYGEIAAESGIEFFTEAGAMMAGSDTWMAQVSAASDKVHYEELDIRGLFRRFPYFAFEAGTTGFYEHLEAGHVSPRNLALAQNKAAEAHGARILPAEVLGVAERGEQVFVEVASGNLAFDQVLVAAGGWTDIVLGRLQHLSVYARTVAFFQIDQAEVERLSGMPSLIWEAPEDPYLLPPIEYPDGQVYVKLGGDPEDVELNGPKDIGDWFRSGGNPDVRDRLHEMVLEVMPELTVQSVKMDACVTSWTSDRYPEIRRLGPGLCVCTGGNGAGAKCSDELGRRGAELILREMF